MLITETSLKPEGWVELYAAVEQLWQQLWQLCTEDERHFSSFQSWCRFQTQVRFLPLWRILPTVYS